MDLLKLFLSSTGVSTDTRSINPGNVFFALKGHNFNGNLYAEKALQLGAKYAVVDEYEGNDPRYIKVQNSLQTLQSLANLYSTYLKIPILGITGSNGKTTSKELIAAVIGKKYKLNYTKGNLNNEIGVPLTILATPLDAQFLIVEMGANHQGEIDLLASIARPKYGLITNIGKAHLEGFGGLEGVKKGKSELYRYLAKNNGKIFINKSDETLTSLLPIGVDLIEYEVLNFTAIQDYPYLKLKFENYTIDTFLSGTYNIANVASAVAIGRFFEVVDADIIEAIAKYSPSNNRSELIDYNGLKVIKDAYNANPSSVMSSLQSFFNSEVEGKSIILGDMLELGEYSMEEHENILKFITEKTNLTQVILVGPIYYNFKPKYPKFSFYKDTIEAKASIKLDPSVDKIILIKGSRGISLEKLID